MLIFIPFRHCTLRSYILEPVWCGSALRAPVPEPEPFCRSLKSWLRLPYEKTAPPHSFHAGSAPTTCIVWCGSTAGAGARAVQEPHQTGPTYDIFALICLALAWMTMTLSIWCYSVDSDMIHAIFSSNSLPHVFLYMHDDIFSPFQTWTRVTVYTTHRLIRY